MAMLLIFWGGVAAATTLVTGLCARCGGGVLSRIRSGGMDGIGWCCVVFFVARLNRPEKLAFLWCIYIYVVNLGHIYNV